MDVFEKLFQKFAQSEVFNKKVTPGLLRLQDMAKYLNVFANSVVLGPVQVQVVASRDYIGLYGSQLFLPEKIKYFEDSSLNKNLYQNLILQILGSHHLKLHGPTYFEAPIVQRLQSLQHSARINIFLDNLLPGYRSFQMQLLHRVEKKADCRTGYQKQIFQYWKTSVMSREPVTENVVDALIKSSRSRDPMPGFLFVTVPSLERVKPKSLNQKIQSESLGQKNTAAETDVEKTYSSVNQTVDLEKEKANPVMHSFEKLETADEYSGGRRMDSGDDELEDHSKALDELNLNKVTRGGEAAKSIYSAEAFFDFEFSDHSLEIKQENGHFFYPEWNLNKSSYLLDHCHLVENPLEIVMETDSFRENLLSRNRFQIKHWQSRIQSLFSEPLWQKKLKEGDEIDVDEVIRDLGAILRRKDVSARWYMSRKKQFNDVEIIILFDQSHSSDSWICNRRILDITLESVGIAGLLFDKIFEAVTVAGIWSSTRHNCSFQIYKQSCEPWSSFFKKAKAIQAQGYTRLGPAIRHATSLLKKSTHKKKLIVLLTDGKPTDVDGYEGAVGVSDVAQACREAELSGILHYALILDHKQKVHFSKMFKHYRLLHDPKHLSEELFNILFQLIKV